jgi:tRNA(Ile)-lysidine synthase
MEQRVAGFIRLHGLFAGAGRILLAISGGADSTALLHVLLSLRTDGLISAELVCAHVNHQLRGQASDEDQRLVIEEASRLGLPTVTRTVDVRACVKARRLSIETAARRLRIESLSEIARTSGCAWVATGHQKNDNAETVIQRLRRGTGFRGLAGIWPARQFDEGSWFARPLLDVTREEIVAYLHRRGLAWREDLTNMDLTYTRNYIRHKLLPALRQESHGSLVEELSELAASARRLYERVQRSAEAAMSQVAMPTEGGIALAVSRLSSLPELVAVELVRQTLVKLGSGEQNLTQDHYTAIMELARHGGRGGVALPGGFTARREGETVLLSRRAPRPRRVGLAPPLPSLELSVPGESRFAGYRIEATVLDAAEFKGGQINGDQGPFHEYFDLDCVRQPVVVRSRRAGDRFRPLGLAGEKKLGKFLTTAKAPRELREHILVFADQEKIIWICPVRIAEPVKVTERTRRILVLKANVEPGMSSSITDAPSHADGD